MAQKNINIRIDKKLKEDPFYSTANMERLKIAIQDAESGKLTIHDIIDTEDKQ